MPFIGGLASATVDIRLILKRALRLYAISIILCHNQLAAVAQPQKEDEDLDKRLSAAARCMDIKLLDHLIIGENNYYSFADEGKLS